METIDLHRFYSGGYFLIQAGNPGWEQLKTELLPETLISLSDCIALKFNVNWGWPTGDKSLALRFGIQEQQWDEFVTWCYHDYRNALDIMSMFYTPDAARRIVKRFLPQSHNLHLIGVGLPLDFEAAYWREPTSAQEIYGIEKRIEQHIPMVEGGQPLGFELVSFEYGEFGHSWLCNYLFPKIHAEVGIRPSQYGLLQSEQDVNQVCQWIEEDSKHNQYFDAQPYDYWLLMDYPLDSQ